jgi:hypothetical protein
MTVKKTPKTQEKVYNILDAARLRKTTVSAGKNNEVNYLLEYISTSNDAVEINITKKLLTAIEEDGLTQNYRVKFSLHQNEETGEVEYITTLPKNIYGAYEVEYEDDMTLPEKDVYQPPPE